MANIQCPECGKEISDQNMCCEHCGFPLKESAEKDLPNPVHRWSCVNCGAMTSEEMCQSCGKSSTKKEKISASANTMSSAKHAQNRSGAQASGKIFKYKSKRKTVLLISLCFVLVILVLAAVYVTVALPYIQYNQALDLLNKQEYVAAFAAFEKLGDYKDAKAQAAAAQENVKFTISNEQIITFRTETWTYPIAFGDYLWDILAIEGNKALLLSTNAVENMPFNEEDANVTWESCTLRRYLNEEFYNMFSDEERAMILPVENENPSNEAYGTPGGEKTIDKIFLLSLDEIETYGSRIDDFSDSASWWLRSPGESNTSAACVGTAGDVFDYGFNVGRSGNGVRPAIWVNISSTEEAEKIIEDFHFTTENGKTTIPFGDYTWQLLAIQENQALFITEDIIDLRPYHTSSQTTWWSECDLRNYLNTDFYDRFSDQEKLKIVETQIYTGSNNRNYGGPETPDKIFLLSQYDVETYLPEMYGASTFGYYKNRVANYQGQPFLWWLRQPGFSHEQAMFVDADGEIDSYGAWISSEIGVRPAMWLKLVNTGNSQETVSINPDPLSDIGQTFSALRQKHGEVEEHDWLDGGIYSRFESSPNLYFFKSEGETSQHSTDFTNLPAEGDLCFIVDTNAKTFFNNLEGSKPISDIEKELGFSLNCSFDEMDGVYTCNFTYQNYKIRIRIGDSATMIPEDASVRIQLNE